MEKKEIKRLGIYGGSFDPIHYAHLLLAETARDECQLDAVVFVPAGIPPHKRFQKKTSGELRYQMIQAAIAPFPEFWASRFEIDSTEISYTVQTLRYFHAELPRAQLFLIVGADMFYDIPHWFLTHEICESASLIVANRAGQPTIDFSALNAQTTSRQREEFQRQVVAMPLLDISSSTIRQRVEQGKSIRFQTPESVIHMINEHQLYLQKE